MAARLLPAIDDQSKEKAALELAPYPAFSPSTVVGEARIRVFSARARGDKGGTNERTLEKTYLEGFEGRRRRRQLSL